MHGMIGTQRNRRGRKRKSGKRHTNGHLMAEKKDIRDTVLAQPHRRRFPEAVRGDQRAESYLGSLNLEYRISESRNSNEGQSRKARLVGVTDHQYMAGQTYAKLVARYLAMCNAPRLAQPVAIASSEEESWRSAMLKASAFPEANWRVDRESDDEKLTTRYMRAYEAVSESVGHAGHRVINRVVIENQRIYPDQFDCLRVALNVLAVHFGLTREPKSCHTPK